MEQWNRLKNFTVRNRDLLLEVVRIYLGVVLFAKGVYFASHLSVVMSMLHRNELEVVNITLAHLIAMGHLAGGFLVAAGLLTRLAAALQVPILLGAVFLVHLREGLFGAAPNLEYALLVLLLLVSFSFNGGGRWSADWLLARRQALLNGRQFPPTRGEPARLATAKPVNGTA